MACVNIVRFAADAELERKSILETSLNLIRHVPTFQRSYAKSDVRILVFSNVWYLMTLYALVRGRLNMNLGLVRSLAVTVFGWVH